MRRIPRLSSSVLIEMRSRLERLISRETEAGCKGQDLIEYALMAGFVAVAIAAFIPYTVTGPITTIFTKLGNYLVTRGNG